MRQPPPLPPADLPPGHTLLVPGRGEFFVRDSGGDGPAVMLLHGWMVSADLNWHTAYGPLRDAGYRVLAMDHRGHGRGLRTPERFHLGDCADDAAAVIEQLDLGPVVAVGYSMGGPITSLLARGHPELLAGIVMCATASDWRATRRDRLLWTGMPALRFVLGAFPGGSWRAGMRLSGFPNTPRANWFAAELTRGSPRDIAEAGRELGRFDSRSWIGSLKVPAAAIVTARDRDVPPYKQRELAQLLGAASFEIEADHAAIAMAADEFNSLLFQALAAVHEQEAAEATAPR